MSTTFTKTYWSLCNHRKVARMEGDDWCVIMTGVSSSFNTDPGIILFDLQVPDLKIQSVVAFRECDTLGISLPEVAIVTHTYMLVDHVDRYLEMSGATHIWVKAMSKPHRQLLVHRCSNPHVCLKLYLCSSNTACPAMRKGTTPVKHVPKASPVLEHQPYQGYHHEVHLSDYQT